MLGNAESSVGYGNCGYLVVAEDIWHWLELIMKKYGNSGCYQLLSRGLDEPISNSKIVWGEGV